MPSSACQTCALDRKSTRLNSSHTLISYAVFCLKKKYRLPNRYHEGTAELQPHSHLVHPLTHLMAFSPPLPYLHLVSLLPPRSSVFFFLKVGPPPEFSPFPHPAPLPI